ncbi:MAG: Sjogren's syndrome/scleroderma autoantigen 1 family protein [Thermoproteota archaeon]
MNEDKVKEMAKLLLSGAIMLAEQCPVCGAPLFRLKDNTIKCPSCGYTKTEKKEIKPKNTIGTEKEILAKKLELLLQGLEKSQDVNEIRTILEAIRIIHELIKET